MRTTKLKFGMIPIVIGIMRMKRAKLFMTGRSQAVRLPKEFRFAGESVLVRREGRAVILEPDGWPEGWVESFAGISSDFERPEQGSVDDHPRGHKSSTSGLEGRDGRLHVHQTPADSCGVEMVPRNVVQRLRIPFAQVEVREAITVGCLPRHAQHRAR